ncbi:hypothetical protein E3H11_04355 [Bradyrhizobium brasilense]|uniref:hypothetical protein n=1 Tax=Bradyrhizobium brasilense TaxID=1419277 RepID=UPI0014565145|nr:hypothetical protein [Bradyrhizobium brasilense]NLS68165.1 hypothetical protein [Bradyrhizobium brasilense]
MSQFRNAFLGAVAITLTLGAVQLASGHDLTDRWQANAVNRAGKADRLGDHRPPAIPMKTVALRLTDTSVLILRPSAQLPTTKPNKPTLACEPMVSVLTDVAKLLPPGRCVT